MIDRPDVSGVMLKSVLCAALLIAGTASAAAAADTDLAIRYVQTADLNLASARGIATLDHRIAAAIADICESDEGEDLAVLHDQRECRAHARASVVDQKSALLAAARGDRTTRVAVR